jgi:ADP-heptose:LPS heptosyltransferase
LQHLHHIFLSPRFNIMIMSTLAYHSGALGDFLTTVPALSFWKKRAGKARLVLLGKPSIGEFAKDTGLVDEAYDVNDKRFLPLFLNDFSSETDTILSPFQTAILFAVPDSPILKNIRNAGIPSLYWQPPFPAERLHAIDYHLSLFTDPKLLDPEEKIPRISPPEKRLEQSRKFFTENLLPVALHPGSGSRIKNWPFECFLLVAEVLRKKGTPILWLLGPAEEGIEVPAQDIVVSNQPFALCAALLSRCRAFIGNDSGMAHLAAAAGCRTVALFGPSDPDVWAPRGKDVHVIYKNKPCSPCHRTPAGIPTSCDNGCMNGITVEEVFDKI